MITNSRNKKPIKKKSPIIFEVSYPLDTEPREIRQREVNKILDYLKKISNDEYQFVFETPHFWRMKPN